MAFFSTPGMLYGQWSAPGSADDGPAQPLTRVSENSAALLP